MIFAGFLLLICALLVVVSLLRIFLWSLDYRAARLEADYRAFVLVETAKREARR